MEHKLLAYLQVADSCEHSNPTHLQVKLVEGSSAMLEHSELETELAGTLILVFTQGD